MKIFIEAKVEDSTVPKGATHFGTGFLDRDECGFCEFEWWKEDEDGILWYWNELLQDWKCTGWEAKDLRIVQPIDRKKEKENE